MHHARAVMWSALVLSVSTAGAQPSGAQVEAGSRVRVTTAGPSSAVQVGLLVSLDSDSLRYRASDTAAVTVLPLTSVARLQHSTGRRSNAGRGATIGGLIGGGLGLVLGIAASGENDSIYEVGPEEIAIATVLLGGIGAGVGALIGSGSQRERWETVPLVAKVY